MLDQCLRILFRPSSRWALGARPAPGEIARPGLMLHADHEYCPGHPLLNLVPLSPISLDYRRPLLLTRLSFPFASRALVTGVRTASPKQSVIRFLCISVADTRASPIAGAIPIRCARLPGFPFAHIY